MPVLGITRVANVTGLDTIGIPVVMVCRPNARSMAVSQGKGLDLDAARASGLMEALELYHAERIGLPLKLATHDELRFTHSVIDPDTLPRVSRSSFHGSRRILWIEAVDLLADDPVWLPFELVHTDFTLPMPTGSGCFPASSNGLASGNHPVEATLHAICEVIERHCDAIWDALPPEIKERTRLDPGSIDDAACVAVLDRYREAGIAVGIWEMTSNIGVPAFSCSIVGDEGSGLPPLFSGHGCHPSREVALLRALTEAAQSRLTFIAGSRDDLLRSRYGNEGEIETIAAVRAAPGPAARSFAEVPTHDADTLEGDLAWVLERLRAAGVDRVVCLDLTRPEFGVPVVRVVVPRLQAMSWLSSYLPAPIDDGPRGLPVP